MIIPNGNVTFLFTDIEGSTKLSQEFPETLQSALDRHHAIMHEAIESNNGFIFEIVGDAFCCAFENADDAVKAAVDAQIKLVNEKWDDVKIKIRIGIHTGNVEWNGKRYMGYITLARTARVMSAAYGKQIIISNDVYELAKEKIPGDISFRDLGERRLKDLKQPARLYQIVSDGLVSDFPPLKTLDARPNNLAVQLTSFIGREAELKTVKDLLKQTHLLTLTGSGGSGKTRFALQVAADVIDDFANGVWFVELASLFEPSLLPQAIMKVFDVKEEPKRSLEDTLCDYLRDKEILIILDNCEHLVEACAKLTEKLLSNSPKLKILATSREALRCEGEQTHRVLSLEVPDPKKENSPEQLSQYEAVRLFIERALSVDSTFRVNNNNAPALAQICYQLDGIPLAIELAAARTKVLTVEKIYERLNDRFNLLTGGKRTALPRQQTLRALIDWSDDLLSEREKILWRRLSVFEGGWTLEAAEEVCSGEKLKKEEVLELLNQLTEKSIIVFEREKERYRILETLKQYGGEKLKDANEVEDVLSKHLHYFMEFAETAESQLVGIDSQVWLEKFEADQSNFQSAIEWSIKKVIREKGARLTGALGKFWGLRGYYTTGRTLTETILHNSQGINKTVLGKVLNSAGVFTLLLGDCETSKKFFEESLLARRFSEEKLGIAESLNSLGNIEYYLGNYEKAHNFFEESLILRREIGEKNGISTNLGNLGNIAYYQGNIEQAQKYYEESLSLIRQTGEKNGIAFSLTNIGILEYNSGNYEKAKVHFEEGLTLFRDMGYKRGIANSLIGLGNLEYNLGNIDKVQKYYEESLSMSMEIGEKRLIANSLFGLGNWSFKLGNYVKAKKFYKECIALQMEMGNKNGIVLSLIGLIRILNTNDHLSFVVNLLGVVDAALESKQAVLSKLDQEQQKKFVNSIHEKLSDEEFYKYFEEGRKLTLEQAAELALSNDQ